MPVRAASSRFAAVPLVLVIVASACDARSATDGPSTSAPSPPGSAIPAPTSDPASAAPGGLDLAAATVVAGRLEVPWGLGFLPDGGALVTERETGRILRIAVGAEPREVARIDGLPATGEGGLLGLAISPDDPDLVYLFVNTGSASRIVRLRTGAGTPAEVILDDIPATSFHTGGGLAFGPDGMLYASVGDAQDGELSQDPASLAGKLLRLTPDGAIPPDNPDPGSAVYASGFRNVEGFTWDDRDRLWAVDFGASTADELDLVEAGANYGWPRVEGTAGEPAFRGPALTWTPAEASPPGVAFAHGTLWVTALRGERLWRVPLGADGEPGTPEAFLVGAYGRLRSAAAAPDGALWISTSNADGRGDPGPDDDRLIRIPVVGG